jgi:dTDP-4-dehydrorhamnose reductase
MKLLVTGANGQVGWELSRSLLRLGEVVALDRGQFDLSQPDGIASIVRSINPDIIVNAAAYTAVDKAEDEQQLAMTVNGTAVGILAEEARRADALLVHYSTDYVFDGTKLAPYLEDDPPCPISSYGRSKLAGETAIRQVGGVYLILRTSWVYAARRQNFLRTVLRLARERDELRIVADQIGTPTWARNIADATSRIIRQSVAQRTDGSFVSGILHLTDAGSTTWHGFARVILDEALRQSLLQRVPKLHAISTEEYPTPAARPRNSQLAGDRLRERFGIVPPDWKDGVSVCLDELKKTEQGASSAA